MRKSGKPGLPPGAFRIDVDKLLQGQGNSAGAGLSFVDKAQPLFTVPAKRTLWEAADTTDTTGRGRKGAAPATPSFAAVPTLRQKALQFQKTLTTPVRKQAPTQKPQTVRKIQPRRAAVEASQFSSAARPEAFQPRQHPDNSPEAQRARLVFAHGGPDVSEVHEMVKQARLTKWGVREQDLTPKQLETYLTPKPPTLFSPPTWDKNYQIAQDALFQFNGNIPRDTPEVAAAKKAEREHWSNNLWTSLYQAYDGAMTTSNAMDLDLAGDHLGAAFLLHNADKSDPATFGRGFSDDLAPSAGGVAGAGVGASALGTFGTFVGGPVGGVVGGIAGGIGGGYLGDAGVRRLQDEALKSTLSPQAYQSLLQLRQEDQTQRAAAYGGGQLAAQLIWMQPKSPGELWEDGSFLSRVLRPGGMAAERATLGNTAFVGAMGRLAGDGINVALPVGQELLSAYQEGRPVNSGPLFVNAGLTLFAKNNRAGDALYNGGRIVGTGVATVVPYLAQRTFGTTTKLRIQPPKAIPSRGTRTAGRGTGAQDATIGEFRSYNLSGTDPVTSATESKRLSRKVGGMREKLIARDIETAMEVLRKEGRPLLPFGTGKGDEIFALYGLNNKLLRARQGDQKRVRWGFYETDYMSDKQREEARKDTHALREDLMEARKSLHNHPLGWDKPWHSDQRQGNSFSPTDIEKALKNEIPVNLLVTPGWTFKMIPNKEGDWNETFYTNRVLPAIGQITQQLRDAGHEPNHADFDHRVMLELHKRGLLIYSYDPSGAPWWQVKKRYSVLSEPPPQQPPSQ